MKILKSQKAQGAIEYLLLIGGAILIATLIGFYLKTIPQQTSGSIEQKPKRHLSDIMCKSSGFILNTILTTFTIALAIFAALILDVINSVASASTTKAQNYFNKTVSSILK
jgi:uncharacterized protein (UPF0333 family)